MIYTSPMPARGAGCRTSLLYVSIVRLRKYPTAPKRVTLDTYEHQHDRRHREPADRIRTIGCANQRSESSVRGDRNFRAVPTEPELVSLSIGTRSRTSDEQTGELPTEYSVRLQRSGSLQPIVFFFSVEQVSRLLSTQAHGLV